MAISSYGAGTFAAAPIQAALATNYIDFASGTGVDWSQQFLPDLIEQEAEIFGNRTISGFLSQVGAEEAMTSDQVIWSEQGRLHLSYTATCEDAVGGNDDASDNRFTIIKDVDGNTVAAGTHGVRVGDTVLVANSSLTLRGYVKTINASDNNIEILPYGAANFDDAGFSDAAGAEAYRILVFGSEHAKGTTGKADGNKPQFKSHTNKPIIIKDLYEVSGSDASQIGWVEVSGEEGQSGYLWYLKAEGDTRARFSDYLEMTMMEAEKVAGASVVENELSGTAGDAAGTEGLFSAITTRGHVTTGVTGVNAATDLAEFDAILAKFDENGAIEENMLFVDRSTSLAMDDMLASMNSYGAGGTSYGVFNNSEDMALNLGFSGFRRGSYDFYKSDMKYLNDKSTRGWINGLNTSGAIRGLIIPAGVSSVYDQVLGKNLKRPFLHVRYRASQMEDRRLKTWITGSVGGNVTSDLDAMQVNYLSERCLVVQGANNFMLMK
jgi:hypothetical protein